MERLTEEKLDALDQLAREYPDRCSGEPVVADIQILCGVITGLVAELRARRRADLSAAQHTAALQRKGMAIHIITDEDREALAYAREHIEPGNAHPKQDEIDVYRVAIALLDRLLAGRSAGK